MIGSPQKRRIHLTADDELYERLNGELDRVYAEVRSLRVNQHVCWEVQKIIRNNPNLRKPSTFYGWMGNLYAAAMSAAVRRLVDRRKDTVSFVRLLENVKAKPSCVSRKAYKKRCTNPNLPLKYLDKDYDGLIGPVMPHPDPVKIADEIRKLKERTEPLRRFVNEHVAHNAIQQSKSLPTFQELDDAIDMLEALAKRYLHLFRGAVLTLALPTWQYDWKAIFHYP
jgi:hypothetical protein